MFLGVSVFCSLPAERSLGSSRVRGATSDDLCRKLALVSMF